MDPQLAGAIGAAVGMGAQFIGSEMEKKEREEEEAKAAENASPPADGITETTMRQSVGGTMTKTTKKNEDGIITETVEVTKPDGTVMTTLKESDASAPAPKPTRIQNETNKVGGDIFGNIGVQVGSEVVRPEEEGKCIVLELIPDVGCGKPQWIGEFVDGIFTDLTADDFYDILDQKNQGFRGCCPPCANCRNEARSLEIHQRLLREYADKNISMRHDKKTVMVTNVTQNLQGNPNAFPVEKHFFIIAQK